MANSYSIEISGRFNAAQLQTALKDVSKNSELPVSLTGQFKSSQIRKALSEAVKEKPIEATLNAKFSITQIRKALKDAVKNSELTVSVKTNVTAPAVKGATGDGSGGNAIEGMTRSEAMAALRVTEQQVAKTTQFTNAQLEATQATEQFNTALGETITLKTQGSVADDNAIVTGAKFTNNIRAQEEALEKANQKLAQSDEEYERKKREALYERSALTNKEAEELMRQYDAKMKLEEQAASATENATNRASAAYTRELEILQRRLGTLKEGIKLQGGYSEQDVLQAAGLPSNATITRNGALTPTAMSGTWDRYTVSVRNAAGAFDTYQIAVNQATGAVRVLNQGAFQTNKALAAQGETLDRLIIKVAKWAALTTLVYMPIRAFKEALSTLKEVDTELVTIQKVTDLSESQIKSLTSSVYGLASAYGRTADELLAMTSTFARAGFQDQLEEMTELAALTQNVGDLAGDEASQFIIAANAAWHLNGNIDALTSIIDGMNEVTNHSANDFQALSQGISVAGSVFANAGESAQTFTAMLGTVVASTQRSGSEVARGLRTIAMNIRQIKGELEDGEIVDESTISDAAAALSSVGISVSEEGQLRKTSDVLTDLAEKWESLTSAEQSYVASSLAGKRQANVLIALMQNYDEYYKEMENYANGAGSAMRENELYLDSWEAKTAMLKSTWTEFVSDLVDTRLVKDGLDVAIKAVDMLNNNFVQTTLLIGATIKVVDVLGTRLAGLEGGISFIKALGMTVKYWGADLETSLGMMANKNVANAIEIGNIAIPLMAASAVVAGLIALIKKYNEEVAKQKDLVADLNTEYERRFGKNSEYEELLAREKELTDVEQRRLLFLKAEAQAAQNEIDKAQAKYDRLFFKHFHNRDDKYGYKKNEAGYATEAYTQAEHEAQEMQTAYRSLISAYNSGNASLADTTSKLSDFIVKGQETYDTLNNTTEALDEQDKAWLLWYQAIVGAYDRLTSLNEVEEDTGNVIDELANKLESLDKQYLEFQQSLGVVDQAQQELNEQGFISVETFDKLAKAYPDILKSSSALANGYGVEEGALAALISGRETDAKVMLYNAQTAAVQYINSMSNVALATNASTTEILKNIDSLMLQRDALAELGSGGIMSNYADLLANDPIYQRLKSLKEMLGLSSRLSQLIGAGTSTGSGSSSSTNTVLNGINDYYDIIKHRIWLSEQRMGDDVSTEKYQKELQQQAEYYVGLKKWSHDEAEKLRKQGYADESDEIKKLQQIWWEAENWLRDQAKETAEQRKKAIDDVLSTLKDNLDGDKNGLDAQIRKLEALIALEEAYYDTLTEVEKEQAEIDKELKVAKESYQYLDEETRKMLFNESDYAVLSGKLQDIANESAAIYENYQANINALTEDNIYLAEQLTHEFEQQYEAKRKEYEIAKAELAMAKAQTSLQNAQANRNTFMLVDGQFQWVADPKAIKDALENYADAEEEYNEAVKNAARERTKAELEDSKQTLATEKARLEAQYEAIERAWKTITNSMTENAVDISNILLEIAQDATPELRKQIAAFARMLSEVTGETYSISGGTTTTKRDPITVQSVNGQAPAGLQVGDFVQTNGGLWKIVEPNTPGANYNPTTGYWSVKVNNSTKSGSYDNGGVALGKGLLLKDTESAEGVIKPSVMRDILNPTKNKMFENFVSGVSTLLDTSKLKKLNGASLGGVNDNSITVNGMTITGQAADNLAKAMRAVMPLHI